ncbi:LOW QUALITY PROTEIN: hypothetical protein QYF61_002133 [Mycteria americana]|uniref:Reverse transcriptase domain-containing protein n=1 Tax=Mycteria americana TaxID=33587 RepID=A0AAN7P303_MYCAM|nr:LOW QUALITY PROTEIN: hypothetical protein QYF61_002133 [Mycteria americana]
MLAKYVKRQAKAQLKLKLARDVTNYKKGFFRYVNNKQKQKENIGPLLKRRGQLVTNNAEKAEVLNAFFTSVCTSTAGHQALGRKIQVDANTDPPSVKEELVSELLQELDLYRSMGPDIIHLRVLREPADIIVRPLSITFEKLWRSGDFPEDWKKANVTPSYKEGLKEDPGNYRPISLTSVPRKVMERILLGAITRQIKHVIGKSQHGFTKGKLCLTNLIAFYGKVTCAVDVERVVDIVSLDFSKAFHTFSHSLLLKKLIQVVCAVGGELADRLHQKAVVNSSFSNWQPVTSGVPQGSILGSTLFSIFISDLDDGIKYTLMKFADDTKLSGEVDTSETRATLQEDLDRLEEWAKKNLMKFNKDKCKVLHLEKQNPELQHRLGSIWLGSSSVERDLAVLVDNKLNVSEHVLLRQRKPTGCWAASTRASAAEIKKSLSHSTQRLSHVEYCVQFWSPLCKKDVDSLESIQRRATKMIKGLGSLPYEERLRELSLFSLEKRRLRGDLVTMFQYLKGGYKENGDSLFTRSHMEKMRGNGSKLHLGRFQLDTRGKFFTMRTISHWNNLPREVVDSPTLDSFKIQLGRVSKAYLATDILQTSAIFCTTESLMKSRPWSGDMCIRLCSIGVTTPSSLCKQ